VLELGRDAGLVHKALAHQGIDLVTLVKNLDGDIPAQRLVAGTVNDPHAAAGQLRMAVSWPQVAKTSNKLRSNRANLLTSGLAALSHKRP
jgi:hypothetical protein